MMDSTPSFHVQQECLFGICRHLWSSKEKESQVIQISSGLSLHVWDSLGLSLRPMRPMGPMRPMRTNEIDETNGKTKCL